MATVASPDKRQDQTVVEFDVRTDEMLVNMGPQHPSTHGVLRLVLRTDGEVISEVTPHLGYLHRCAEKIGENVTPIQFIPYTDRMDYLAGMNMNLAYSLAVEKLCGMKLPEKANVIRVLIAELNRIASHLVGMGAYGLDLGTFSPFLYAFREREMILDLFEEVCGARLTYSYITIGGVHDDLPSGWVERCREFLNYLKPRIPEYHALLTTNHIFVKRTANIGNLPKDVAIANGCTGPDAARLAGSPPGRSRLGSAPPRTVLRLRNLRFQRRGAAVRRSMGLAGAARDGHRRCLASFHGAHAGSGREHPPLRASLGSLCRAQGSHRIEMPRHLPAGETYVETECPRGQMGFYVVGAPGKGVVPLRVRARSSSFCNLSVTNEICKGCLIADVPAIVGSIDIVMGEIDR